ncbi:hypothetical protein J8273_4434 [Carpediemonas membranifera]|uniref:Uncharacterized protein n=1 Tax=Carpediemonas membranifera TaxID=201153 RepID=A0A8J6BY26_9EUKA|nr:hypothetical protein J8273_4434 [Carpediemonas membranifera]|eukprot:KAG9394071.1 hypothetical protein J8273_4434 [Carpediemonas membranifera]
MRMSMLVPLFLSILSFSLCTCPPADDAKRSYTTLNPTTAETICSTCLPSGTQCKPSELCVFSPSLGYHSCATTYASMADCTLRAWGTNPECSAGLQCLGHKCRMCWDHTVHPEHPEYVCRDGTWSLRTYGDYLLEPRYTAIVLFVAALGLFGTCVCCGQCAVTCLDSYSLRQFLKAQARRTNRSLRKRKGL